MKRGFLFSIFLFAIFYSFSQKGRGFLEIGDKKMYFDIEEKISVYRTINDSIIKCKSKKLHNYNIGAYSEVVEIPINEIKHNYRETFKEKGCSWSRVTDDFIRNPAQQFYTKINFLNDSICYFQMALSCLRVDTVMAVNPVTLEEEELIQVDSYARAKFDLGLVSKIELAQAISNQFNINGADLNLKLEALTFKVYSNTCEELQVNFKSLGNIELIKQRILNLPIGAYIILEDITLENSNSRNFPCIMDNIAMMKLKN